MLDNVLFFFTFHLPKKKKQISPFEQEKKNMSFPLWLPSARDYKGFKLADEGKQSGKWHFWSGNMAISSMEGCQVPGQAWKC